MVIGRYIEYRHTPEHEAKGQLRSVTTIGRRISSNLTALRQAAATAGAGRIFIRGRSHGANKHTYRGYLATCRPNLPFQVPYRGAKQALLGRKLAGVPPPRTSKVPVGYDKGGASPNFASALSYSIANF
jgi:hypothetical protein